MFNMLRKGASSEFGCCDFCDRKNKGRKARKRERHVARQREKVQWRKDANNDY